MLAQNYVSYFISLNFNVRKSNVNILTTGVPVSAADVQKKQIFHFCLKNWRLEVHFLCWTTDETMLCKIQIMMGDLWSLCGFISMFLDDNLFKFPNDKNESIKNENYHFQSIKTLYKAWKFPWSFQFFNYKFHFHFTGKFFAI